MKLNIQEFGGRGASSSNFNAKEYALYKKALLTPEKISPMTENSTDWEALERKYGSTFTKEQSQIRKVLNMNARELREYDKTATYKNPDVAGYVRERTLYAETQLERHQKEYKKYERRIKKLI